MSDNWTAKPFSIIDQFFLDYWLLPPDPADQVKLKRDMNFDAEHFIGQIFKTGGFDGKSYAFRTRYGCKQDLLGPYLPAARAQGLRVLVYLNVHWYGLDFPQEMAIRQADGSLITAYGNGWLSCPNGPFLKYALGMAEDLGEYDVDGAFLDGPVTSICWCDHCRADYRKRFGEEMPKGPFSVPQRRRLEEWRAQIVASFIGQFRETLRRKRPDAVVYGNGTTLGQITWANRLAVQSSDFLGIEGGFLGYGPLQGQFLYKTAATCKLLETLAGGKPGVSFNEHSIKGYDYSVLGRAELDLLYAATIAGGANPWYHINYTSRDTGAFDAASYWNGFIANHRDLLAGTRAVENAALLWSDTTALVGRSAREEEDSVHAQAQAGTAAGGSAVARAAAAQCDHWAAFKGAYSLLARSGIPFRIVTEHETSRGLRNGPDAPIDLLIAPSVAALGEKEFAAMEQFVREGGFLVADDRFALLDGDGQPRDPARIASLLGGTAEDEILFTQHNQDYIACGKGPAFRNVTSAPLPRPTRAYKFAEAASSTGKARPLAFFHEPMAGRYDYLPPVSQWPAVVERPLGKGHVCHMPMNLFEHYNAFAFDDHRMLVTNIVRRHYVPPVEVQCASGHVEALVRGKPGQLHVHLLNYAGNVRPFVSVVPLAGVKVVVHGMNLAGAHVLHLHKSLAVRAGRKATTVRLPRLGVAESLVLDLA